MEYEDVMICAVWYHLYNLKNVKSTHGGVLLLVKFQTFKSNTPPWVFSRFLNCANGTKACNASHIRDNSPFVTLLLLSSHDINNIKIKKTTTKD